MISRLTEEGMKQVLHQNVLGRIGCTDGKRAYVVPINYAYDGKNIICHSQDGLKIRMMQANPEVCFEVDEIESFTEWKSVIAYGRYEELTDETGRFEVMRTFVDRMMHVKLGASAKPPQPSAVRIHPRSGNVKTYVFRIVITELTGRFESQDEANTKESI